MRMLREAAVAVAVAGAFSMIGAGVATAHTGGGGGIQCLQNTGDKSENKSVAPGVIGIAISDALNGGDADASSNQQICGNHNKNNESEGGDAKGGDGLDLL
jgi:hypothetical protein